IRKNGGLHVHDPSPIAGRGQPPSPALLYLTKKQENHKTSTLHEADKRQRALHLLHNFHLKSIPI
ncbi:hypothetical protein, partial [Rhizobium paknamense]|uniref:hypothetical protein n=1 Tax=Rhizobium paknamense TaxID=1206817 RepID=UPI0035E6908C